MRRVSSKLLSAPDIPFDGDEANRFLPWIVSFMVCLTALMLAAALTLNLAVHRWNGNYLNSFTIQMPQWQEGGQAPAAPEDVVRLVRENEWVDDVTLLEKAELEKLIEPWLGDGEVLKALPLPHLIEVRIKQGQTVDIEALQKRLQRVAPGTEIDDYKLWMAKFAQFSLSVQLVAFILAALLIFTMLAIVILTSKTALRLHQRTVDVLYTIGARDDYIAQQFQRNAVRQVLKGGAIGVVVAVLLFLFLSHLAAGVESSILPPFDVTRGHVILFIALPLLTALAARWSTRMAVLSLLRQKP